MRAGLTRISVEGFSLSPTPAHPQMQDWAYVSARSAAEPGFKRPGQNGFEGRTGARVGRASRWLRRPANLN